jgi:hypothetical protein
MEQIDNDKSIYYGIRINQKSTIDPNCQKEFFRLMLFHPWVSANIASILYLYPYFKTKSYKDYILNWVGEIEDIVKDTSSYEQKKLLEQHMAEKISEWIEYFSLPSPLEIAEMARYLQLSEASINEAVCSYYLTDIFCHEEFMEYMAIFAPYIPEKMIDKLLDRYSKFETVNKF